MPGKITHTVWPQHSMPTTQPNECVSGLVIEIWSCLSLPLSLSPLPSQLKIKQKAESIANKKNCFKKEHNTSKVLGAVLIFHMPSNGWREVCTRRNAHDEPWTLPCCLSFPFLLSKIHTVSTIKGSSLKRNGQQTISYFLQPIHISQSSSFQYRRKIFYKF